MIVPLSLYDIGNIGLNYSRDPAGNIRPTDLIDILLITLLYYLLALKDSGSLKTIVAYPVLRGGITIQTRALSSLYYREV